mgnify:CR=1 FL=1
MKILDKSYELAIKLFPDRYKTHKSRNFYHFSFIFHRNRLLTIGVNSQDKPNAKALFFAKRFGIKRKIEFPYIHSEISGICKLWGNYHIDGSVKFVNVRINRFGELKNSKPCDDCSTVLTALGINEIYYSTNEGFIKL